MFAMPIGSDQFYEFNVLAMISGDGSFGVETDISDWKYIKRMRKGRVLLKFGVLMFDGTRMVINGFITGQERDVMGCTFRFEVTPTTNAEILA